MMTMVIVIMMIEMMITQVVVVFDDLFPVKERTNFRFHSVKDMQYLTFAFSGLVNGPV